MGREGCLAQSPQLYKQMAIMADQEKVFEIGPVFRCAAACRFTQRIQWQDSCLTMRKEHCALAGTLTWYNDMLLLPGAIFVMQ